MPMQETSLPVEARAFKVTANGRDYQILRGTDSFDRAGEDGDIPIIPLCRGDEFVGEVPEGQWKKGWDADMSVFTAHIDTGLLEISGVSDNPGVDTANGWINNTHPIVMMNGAEVTVAMEVPTDDTGAEDTRYSFFIRREKDVTSPRVDQDFIRIWLDVDNVGMLFYIQENVDNTVDTLFSGSTYDDATGRDTGTGVSTIWRIVFHDGVAGAVAPEDVRHMHIYLKQGANLVAAEAATENELSNSPYDINAYLFDVGYPAYHIYTVDGTYFGTAIDSGNEALSAYLRVNYSSLFSLKYDFADVDVGMGDVELWDGDPDVAASIQVFDEDHFFIHDPYIQNGLLRLHVDELIQYGLKPYSYYGAAWNQPFDQIWFNAVTDNEDLTYPMIRYIEQVSPEKTAIIVRLLDSNTANDDYYLDIRITLERGKYSIKLDSLDVYPDQDVKFWFLNTTTVRFGYVGDDEIGDDNVNVDGDNTTMTDNFLIAFDDLGEAVIGVVYTDEEPAGSATPSFFAEDGGDLAIEDVDSTDISGTRIWVSLIPFSLVANLFEEAEGGDYTGTTPGNDPAASPPAGNNYVLLDAIGDFQTPAGEYSTYQFDAGTHLPEGRYLAVIRARYVDEETMRMYVWNDDDDVYRNEENAKVTKTLAVTFGYHSVVFDITAADVTGTDTFAIVAEKSTDDADEIRIDYMLVIPIGNGESFPQDCSHGAMRNFNKPKRLYVR